MTGNSGKKNITASICSHTCLLFTSRKAWVFSLLKLQVSKRMSIYLAANCVSKLWWIVMLRVHCKVFHQISINKMGLSPSVDIYVYAGILYWWFLLEEEIKSRGLGEPCPPPLPRVPYFHSPRPKPPVDQSTTQTWPSIIIILTFVQVVCYLRSLRFPLYDKVPYAGCHRPWHWSPIQWTQVRANPWLLHHLLDPASPKSHYNESI